MAPSGSEHFRPQSVPLLDQRNDSDERQDHDDDLEIANRVPSGGLSRQSAFDLDDATFEHIPLQSRSSWTSKLRKYVYSFPRSTISWSFKSTSSTRARSRNLRVALYCIAITLMMLGVIQFISLSFLTFAAIFPDQAAYFLDHWGDPAKSSQPLLHWPTDFSRDIEPVPCHSHNDYWRKIPLYSALQAGCISVEADVWLVEDELYVGHSTASLTPNRTLKNLYINPLLDILTKQNPRTKFHPEPDSPPSGVFDTDPAQTLVLLVDFKTDGHSLWPHVYAQLEPLRQAGYLTHYDGTSIINRAITICATGNAPFDLLTSNSTYRDIFFDAPLDRMSPDITAPTSSSPQGLAQGTSGNAPTDPSSYNPTNSYYASTSFSDGIGIVWSEPSASQLERIRSQIQGAHDRGLKARYWETPAWPRGLRNHIWNVLVREGVDLLNVDDLAAATGGAWGEWT